MSSQFLFLSLSLSLSICFSDEWEVEKKRRRMNAWEEQKEEGSLQTFAWTRARPWRNIVMQIRDAHVKKQEKRTPLSVTINITTLQPARIPTASFRLGARDTNAHWTL